MKPDDLKPGMKYFFFPTNKIQPKAIKNSRAYKILSIRNDDSGYYIESEAGYVEYADWHHIWILHDDGSIEQVEAFDELNKTAIKEIWVDQENFNKLFFDAKSLTIEQKQQKTKDYVLHLTAECLEVLNEINWKMHRYSTRNINTASILEECVDVFKYLLGVMNVWGFSVHDFISMYWEKTAKVKERYDAENNANKK